jgi:acyl dehydratase
LTSPTPLQYLPKTVPPIGRTEDVMPIDRGLIGKEWTQPPFEVTAAAIEALARAYGDENPLYLHGKDAVAPPVFALIYAWEASVQPVFGFDPALLMKLVRGGIDLKLPVPVRAGDVVTTVAKLTEIEEKSSGEIVHIVTTSRRGDEVVAVIDNAHFIRGRRKDAAAAPGAATEPPPPEPGPVGAEVLRTSVTVDPEMPRRYGPPSQDVNPIHMDDSVAQAAGFPSIILQGSCTMALAGKAIVDGLAGGDARRLKRLAVRFSKPVLPNDVLTTVGRDAGKDGGLRRVAFETLNQSGVAVLKDGLAELA